MCGIFGAFPLSETVRKMLPILGIEMEGRGRDAWGASNGEEVIRHVGPLTESWYISEDAFAEWKAGIFHTRGASHGSPKKLENAHPFTFQKEDGTSVIGIHNGIVSNHMELDSKYGRNFEVDSMHLWKHRADGLPWTDIEGWGNLAWWETSKDPDTQQYYRALHFLRFNNSALELFRLEDGEYIFCSTQAPVRVAARMNGNPVREYLHLDEYTDYYIRVNEKGTPELWKGQKVPFVNPTTRGGRRSSQGGNICSVPTYPPRLPGVPMGPANTPNYTAGRWDNCVKCGHARVNIDEALLCNGCFQIFVTEFEYQQKEQQRGYNL